MDWNKIPLRKIFLGVAGCIVLYWLLHETERLMAVVRVAGNILSPFLVGGTLAFILNVPMRGIEGLLKKIQKAALRRAVAITLTVVAFLLVLYGVFYLLIPQIGDTIESLAQRLPVFLESVRKDVFAYLNENPELMELLSEYTSFNSMDWSGIIEKVVTWFSESFAGVLNKTVSAVIDLGTGIFNGILSLVFALYCLARKEILARQGRRLVYSILPEKISDEIVRISRMTNITFSRFISGQCLEALILGSMFAVTMPIFGMPYVPLISVIIAITALVPIVGAFAGCIIGAFFILVVDPALAFWFIVLFLVLQQIEGNLIYPRVVGGSIGLPGMWVLLAVAVGGSFMGVGGMLLMIPLASVCYSLAREFTAKRLAERNVPREKVQDQPLQFADERIKRKKKSKKAEQKEENE